MICRRCRGLMTHEELRDWGGGKGHDRSSAFRCIPCGDIIDPVILHNRTSGAGPTTGRKKQARFDVRVISIHARKACAAKC
jgi:hypothetical protein